MDFSLGQERRDYYKKLPRLCARGEFSAETVVPDTQEDIKRIAYVSGGAVVRTKSASGGIVSLSGEISVSAVYVPESGEGTAALNASVPFSFELQYGSQGEALPVAEVRVASLEARILNPRKVLIRAELSAGVDVYVKSELCWSTAPADFAASGLRLKFAATEASLVRSVTEKSFVVAEELALPQGKPAPERLLTSVCHVRFDDAQSVGGKLIVKGTVGAELMYLPSGGGDPEYAALETQFSQLVEAGEGVSFETAPMLTDSYVELAAPGAGEPSVSLEVHAVAQVVCRGKETIVTIEDAYYMKGELSAESEELSLESAAERFTAEASPRGQFEFQRPCSAVIGTAAETGDASVSGGSVSAGVTVHTAYIGTDGELYGETFTFTAQADCGEGAEALNATAAGVTAIPSGMGLEIRAQVIFQLRRSSAAVVSAISSVTAEEESNASRRPSVTVVRADTDDIWLIARKYRADADAIRRCNGLDSGQPLTGKILLIP